MSFQAEVQIGPEEARVHVEKVNQRDLRVGEHFAGSRPRQRPLPLSMLRKDAHVSLREMSVTVPVDTDSVSRGTLGYGSPPNQPMATPAHESFSWPTVSVEQCEPAWSRSAARSVGRLVGPRLVRRCPNDANSDIFGHSNRDVGQRQPVGCTSDVSAVARRYQGQQHICVYCSGVGFSLGFLPRDPSRVVGACTLYSGRCRKKNG